MVIEHLEKRGKASVAICDCCDEEAAALVKRGTIGRPSYLHLLLWPQHRGARTGADDIRLRRVEYSRRSLLRARLHPHSHLGSVRRGVAIGSRGASALHHHRPESLEKRWSPMVALRLRMTMRSALSIKSPVETVLQRFV